MEVVVGLSTDLQEIPISALFAISEAKRVFLQS